MAGPVLTRANLRDHVRLHVRDTSTTSPGLSDAQVNSLLNEALFSYASLADGDEVLFNSVLATLSAGSNGATLFFSVTPLSLEALYLVGVGKLTRKPLLSILQHQEENPNETGIPQFFAIDSAGTRDSWAVYLNCKADQGYSLSAWYRKEPTAYAGESTTTPFGDHAAYVISRMAMVEAARLLGRPQEFINNIASSLPDRIRSAMGVPFRSGTHGGATHAREP